MIKTASGLNYIILKKGNGPGVRTGEEILIYETASYLNGAFYIQMKTPAGRLKFLSGDIRPRMVWMKVSGGCKLYK